MSKHNPERTTFRGRSYRKGGKRIADLRRRDAIQAVGADVRDRSYDPHKAKWAVFEDD